MHRWDPRLSLIEDRLKNVDNIIAVASGKGGVGKSLFSTLLALSLGDKGHKVGLFDLDFHGPSCQVILGCEGVFPEEEMGLIPPEVDGLRFMSIDFFSKGEPVPLRGPEITNVFIEILAITRWGELDFLIIDMPPGIGDEVHDIARFLIRPKFVAITIPSPLAVSVTSRLLKLLKIERLDIIGLVENMRRGEDSSIVEELARKADINYLGYIPFDPKVDDCVGDINCLKGTLFYHTINRVSENIMKFI